MGIGDDFESLRERWSSLSTTTRILFVASLALSFLSIASLADGVYELKSFMAEAIAFWRSVTSPIINIVRKLGWTIESWQIDFWVLAGVIASSFLSVRWKALSSHQKIRASLVYPALFATALISTSPGLAISSVVCVYIIVVLVTLWPPVTPPYALMGIRLLVPPILVAILAAIAEGISRPLT